jgi:serine/threonine protein kinase
MTSQVACPQCGKPLPPEARFCPSCGTLSQALRPGGVLDEKYEILDKLAEGGMGEVFRARHIHLDEIRIIKVMKPGAVSDTSQHRRFQEEARIATLVRHPNVAALYDFSRLPSGAYYMVWEFIDGITLFELVRRQGRLPAADAIEIGIQVLAGLAQIHEAGIVHRDISPDNIMVRRAGEGAYAAKIIDLGIAKRLEEERLRMTGTGIFLGKLKYCSPEQAGLLGPGETLDGRSDLYSFGAVLYEMLAGQAPFDAPTPEGLLMKHLHETPPRLDPARLPADIGEELAAIVARALEKNRERRFRTAGDLAAALSALRQSQNTMPTMPSVGPVRADLEPTVPVTRPARRTRRRAVALGAGLLLVAAVGIGIAALTSWPAKWRPHHAAATEPKISHGGRASTAPASSASTAPSTPSPTAAAGPRTETAAASASVVGPRIIERTTSPTTQSPPSPSPSPSSKPPRKPAGEPAPESEASASASPSSAEHGDRSAIEQLREWQRMPEASRLQGLTEAVAAANRYVAANPDTPEAEWIRRKIPAHIKDAADRAFDNRRFFRAFLLYDAYRRLTFVAPDPEVDARWNRLRADIPAAGGQTGRAEESPAGGRRLIHEPVTTALAGSAIPIIVEWAGRNPASTVVTLFYRSAGNPWRSRSMRRVGLRRFRGEIPSTAVAAPQVDYFIEAIGPSGQSARSGGRDDPHRVAVSP